MSTAVVVDNVDQEISDAKLPDTEVVDTEATDTEIADPETVDTEMADIEVADTQRPNTAVENEDQILLQPAPERSLSLPVIGTEGSHSSLFLPSPVLEASAYRPKVIQRDRIEVKVPPVEQRWEYRPYHAPKDNVSNFHRLFQAPIIPHRLINLSSSPVLVRQGNQAEPILSTGKN